MYCPPGFVDGEQDFLSGPKMGGEQGRKSRTRGRVLKDDEF